MAKIKYVEANGDVKTTTFNVAKIIMKDENGNNIEFQPNSDFQEISIIPNFYDSEEKTVKDVVITPDEGHTAISKVTLQKDNILPENILKNKTIFGVPGSATEESATDAATKSDILLDKYAWVNGQRIKGEYNPTTSSIQSDKRVTLTKTETDINPDIGYGAMAKVTVNAQGVDASKIAYTQSVLGVDGKFTQITTEGQKPGDADLLKGKIAWANGNQITGKMVDKRNAEIQDGKWKKSEVQGGGNDLMIEIPLAIDAGSYCINEKSYIKSNIRNCINELCSYPTGNKSENVIRTGPSTKYSNSTYYYTGRKGGGNNKWEEVIVYGWQYNG